VAPLSLGGRREDRLYELLRLNHARRLRHATYPACFLVFRPRRAREITTCDALHRQRLRDISLRIYKAAADYAAQRGIIIADTKFEFGNTPKGLVLADEVLTPDSSRFWPSDTYQPGRAQESFDKQYVRDYLESIKWNKQPPAPALPEEVARRTSQKYVEAYRRLTGRDLAE